MYIWNLLRRLYETIDREGEGKLPNATDIGIMIIPENDGM